jgi:hypothetical protein
MEGNDLGSHWNMKYVVIAEPTLFIPPPDKYTIRLGGRQYGKRQRMAAEFEMNRPMAQFIAQVARYRNIPTEVWTFITDQEIVDYLAHRLEQVVPNAIVGWTVWEDPLDAVLSLRVDSSIHTVYDADPDRVDRLWGMRGHRVLRGGAPTS